MTSSETPRAELLVWEEPVLQDLGSVNDAENVAGALTDFDSSGQLGS